MYRSFNDCSLPPFIHTQGLLWLKLSTREQILIKRKVISPILLRLSLSVYMWNFGFLNKLYKY